MKAWSMVRMAGYVGALRSTFSVGDDVTLMEAMREYYESLHDEQETIVIVVDDA